MYKTTPPTGSRSITPGISSSIKFSSVLVRIFILFVGLNLFFSSVYATRLNENQEKIRNYRHPDDPVYTSILNTSALIIDSDTGRIGVDTFIRRGAGLPGFAKLVHHHDSVRVAFLGGSITDMEGWRAMVMNYLTKTYPESKFEFLNAGIPSLGSVPHAFRLQQDVLNKMTPDLLFIESAVNDAVNGTPAREQKHALEGIIRQAHQANPEMEMVLMAFADEDKNAEFAKGTVPTSVQIHSDLAAYYQLPFINLAKEVYTRIRRGEFSWAHDFKNLHPAPFGQQLYFEAIKSLLASEIQNGSNQKKATSLKDRHFPEPASPFNYDQGHYVAINAASDLKSFRMVEDWVPHDQAHTRPGFVHVPVLAGTKPGSRLILNFKGTAVGIAVVSGPDAGSIRYQVDDGAVRTMDLHTEWSSQLHLPWYKILGDGLADKQHVLKLEIGPRGSKQTGETATSISLGTAVRIVHFLVNGPGK